VDGQACSTVLLRIVLPLATPPLATLGPPPRLTFPPPWTTSVARSLVTSTGR